MLVRRGLAVVLGDLASLGYDAEWGVLGADDVGAPHIRKRIWIVAHASKSRRETQRICKEWARDGEQVVVCGSEVADTEREGLEGHRGIPGNPQKPELGDNGASDAPVAHADGVHRRTRARWQDGAQACYSGATEDASWWGIEPDVGRVANGVAARVDRLKCIGNGQVPAVAAAAWRILSARLIQKAGSERMCPR
jgi:DNA (cytosine-5)-methyltransferase 1